VEEGEKEEEAEEAEEVEGRERVIDDSEVSDESVWEGVSADSIEEMGPSFAF
jgi:hypothetical protein